MILSKQDLAYYLLEDRKAQHKVLYPSLKQRLLEWLFKDLNYEFTKQLRYCEYYNNCRKKIRFFWKVKCLISMCKLVRLCRETGIELHPNCVGLGIHIVHGKIVVNENSQLGCNCKILSNVTIGIQGRYDKPGTPILGDRVYIGSGADNW